MDRITKEQRSILMSKVKGKNTKPELLLRRKLHALGYRFRLFSKKLPCHPDIVLKKYKTAIFVHGCFWHGHENCKYFRLPKSNVDFWENKIETNRARDAKCIENLESMGWSVIVVWECQLNPQKLETTISHLNNLLQKKLEKESEV